MDDTGSPKIRPEKPEYRCSPQYEAYKIRLIIGTPAGCLSSDV